MHIQRFVFVNVIIAGSLLWLTPVLARKLPTTRPHLQKKKEVKPPPQSLPVRHLFQAILTDNSSLLSSVFSFKARQLLLKRIGLSKAMKAYKGLHKRDFEGVHWKKMRFRFTPKQGPISQPPEKIKEGRVTILIHGTIKGHLEVVKEKGLWKLNSL